VSSDFEDAPQNLKTFCVLISILETERTPFMLRLLLCASHYVIIQRAAIIGKTFRPQRPRKCCGARTDAGSESEALRLRGFLRPQPLRHRRPPPPAAGKTGVLSMMESRHPSGRSHRSSRSCCGSVSRAAAFTGPNRGSSLSATPSSSGSQCMRRLDPSTSAAKSPTAPSTLR
jgi:hypothetical protein